MSPPTSSLVPGIIDHVFCFPQPKEIWPQRTKHLDRLDFGVGHADGLLDQVDVSNDDLNLEITDETQQVCEYLVFHYAPLIS